MHFCIYIVYFKYMHVYVRNLLKIILNTMRKEEYFKRNRGKSMKGKNILNIIKGRISDFMEILLNFKLNEIKVEVY